MNNSEHGGMDASGPSADNPGQEIYKALEEAGKPEYDAGVKPYGSSDIEDPTIPIPPTPGSQVDKILKAMDAAEDADAREPKATPPYHVKRPDTLDL
jgi:hypothetical protein